MHAAEQVTWSEKKCPSSRNMWPGCPGCVASRESSGAGDQEPGTRTGQETRQDTAGSPQSSRAKQVWLKLEGQRKTIDLRGETEEELEEKVRGWMGVGTEMGMYVVGAVKPLATSIWACWWQGCSWSDVVDAWRMRGSRDPLSFVKGLRVGARWRKGSWIGEKVQVWGILVDLLTESMPRGVGEGKDVTASEFGCELG